MYYIDRFCIYIIIFMRYHHIGGSIMNELTILWTNDDITTSRYMVFMYASNALQLGWWDNITLIIWGATATLCKENKEIQDEVKNLIVDGVEVLACKACSDIVMQQIPFWIWVLLLTTWAYRSLRQSKTLQST